MNAKKAKALRKQVGLTPEDPKLYTKINHGSNIDLEMVYQNVITGPRHLYQQVKRGRVSL